MTQAIEDLKRARDVVGIMAKYGFLIEPEFLAKFPGLSRLKPDETISALSRGERAKRVLEELGPTYVKLGQVLSIRPDLLPPDMVESLGKLQKDVAPLPAAELTELVEGYLGCPIDELFESFEVEPLAAASIAQVHRARLRTGDDAVDVVVKIQRPGIREKMESDLSILYWLARLAEGSIVEARLYQPVAIVREFEAALLQELDFQQEGRALVEVAKNFADRPDLLEVPKVYEHVSSQKLLVMGYLEGVRITDIVGDDAYDPKAILDRAIEVIFAMVFEDGFFHGDPHPGNVLVTSEGRIGMLDFGLMGRLSRDEQDTLIQLGLAVFSRNAAQITRIVMKMGDVPAGFDRPKFESRVTELLDEYLVLELAKIDSANLIRDCMEMIIDHRIRLPANFAVLGRAAATIEGIARIIYPDLNIMAIAAPYAARLVRRRLDPTRMSTDLLGLSLTVQQFLTEAPDQATRLLDDLGAGRLQFDVKGRVFEDLVAMERVHSFRMVVTICAATAVLAGAITLAPFEVTLVSLGWADEWAIPVGPLLATLAALGFGFLLALSFLFPRGPQKIALRRLLFFAFDRGRDGPRRRSGR